MPSRVVGRCTTGTPRSQLAATKPPRSLTDPPPRVTTASPRVNPAWPSRAQRSAATSTVLAASASGTTASVSWYPAPVSADRTGSAYRSTPGARMSMTWPAPGAAVARVAATCWSTPAPMMTGYRCASVLPPTWIRWVSVMVLPVESIEDLVGDLGGRAARGVDRECCDCFIQGAASSGHRDPRRAGVGLGQQGP